jgi:hypothetical protein
MEMDLDVTFREEYGRFVKTVRSFGSFRTLNELTELTAAMDLTGLTI